ncbi:MAG: hypothetical protein ACLTSX_03775 [Collinsella sp.]
MYVEHLFEGKVLTPENIELKEEIYGNLVARYEDLIASGLDESGGNCSDQGKHDEYR